MLGLMAVGLCACGGKQSSSSSATSEADTIELKPCPTFVADSAVKYIEEQCAFGPRVTGTEAHQRCGDYLVQAFQQYGCEVTEQKAELVAYDGTKLPGRNIIARVNPEKVDRVLICAHWDCRPWADHDPDEANHRKPILAANDAASGVAVMLEMARLMQQTPLNYGVDFVCFDAEDWGMPEWEDRSKYPNSDGGWCLGSTYWAEQARESGYSARYGVLLDMVGGRGATFAWEAYSRYHAESVVQYLWHLAAQLGYGSYFPLKDGGAVQDDHIPVNQIAGIPCIDIIPHVEHGHSSFGPTWHTVADTPANIDPAVLKAVGQSVLQMLYNDK